MKTATTTSFVQTADYVNPLITAPRTVFEMMLKETMAPKHELSAIIGVTGKVAGTIVLSLSRGAALEVFNRMVGIEVSEIDSDVCDAVGKLTNMIADSAKAQLERLQLSISIPNIISGKDHTVHYPSNVTPICIIFDSEIGPFAIEVSFTRVNQS